ncbi:MAG: MFS transporter [Desulfovibrio sp.]|jgi:MFS family permease|nr:MFS transporter [Desulfovibrio sp.]
MNRSERNIFARLNLGAFLSFLVVGLPLPVLPLYVHDTLGYGAVVVGACVGAHFLAAVLFRARAGRLADIWGARHTVHIGFLLMGCSGLPYIPAAWNLCPEILKLPLITASRFSLGIGHSMVGTGSIAWGLGLLGPPHAAAVVAWSGVAMYAGIGFGSPLGLVLWKAGGLVLLGLACCLLPVLSALSVRPMRETPALRQAEGTTTAGILRQVARSGICLALNGVGNTVVSAFISLYFASRDWDHAAFALSCFGFAFVAGRIFCGGFHSATGEKKAAACAFSLELAGLVMVAALPFPAASFIGVSLVGFGCSLVFPALAVALLRRLPNEVRGTALGCFTAFQDISYAATGPLTGLLVPAFGCASVFWAAAVCAALGFVLVSTGFDRR